MDNPGTPILAKQREARAHLSEGPNFGDLLQVVKYRRKLLYLFTVLAVLGTAAKEIFYVPMYGASTALSIQRVENSPMQMALANLGTTAIDSGDRIKKYLDYLGSNEFLLAVAETLKFQEGYHLLNLTAPAEMGITHRKFWVQFLSTHFGRKAEPHAELSAPEPVLVPVEQLAKFLRGVVTADTPGPDMIRLHVTTLDPFTSMVLANTATEVFVKKTGERDYNEVSEVRRFIQGQLDSTTERLKRSESTLIDFKKTHNIISINTENMAFSQKLSGVDGELENTRIKLQENQKLIDYYGKQLEKSEKRIVTQGAAAFRVSQKDELNHLRQQLDALRYKKVLMQAQGYAETSWQMTELDHEIDKAAAMLKDQLSKGGDGQSSSDEDDGPMLSMEQIRAKIEALKNEDKLLEAKLSSVERSKGTLLKSLESLPRDEQVLLTLTRDVDLQFELYSSLKKKLQEVEIQQVALQSHVLVTERSGVPGPIPRTNFIVKILFALLVGVFLGCTTAFLLEAIDPTIKHLQDLARLELITLGGIPHVEGSPIRQTLGMHSYRPDLLICKEKPESPESMAFKHVRAQITTQRASDGAPAKVLLITSPERGDGKSFVASNLAVSLSQLEKSTLLIDADFRNPSIPWLFGYREGNGLSSLLTLKASLDEVLIRRRVPYLDILPAGWSPPNPSELVSNDKFRVLVEHLRGLYDYIVIDAPPAAAVVDAAVLANLSDIVMMVAGYRKTKKDTLLIALRKILQVSHKHIYALLNNVWDSRHETDYVYGSVTRSAKQGEPVDSRSELERFEQALSQRKVG